MEWPVIESYFTDSHLERLVRHQIESFNDFISHQMASTIEMFNPVVVRPENYYDRDAKQYSLEMTINFVNMRVCRPQIHENNGATKLMLPQEARLRNFTYSAAVTVDMNIQYVVRTGAGLEHSQYFHSVIEKVHIGKMPVMLKSNLCVLSQFKHLPPERTGECRYDPGGYFVINGSEKTVLGQERAAENQMYTFKSNNAKFLFQVELKSVPALKRISPKQVVLYLAKSAGGDHTIQVSLPRVRKPMPLFVVFRALNLITDKAICEMVTQKPEIAILLKGSVMEASEHLTHEAALAELGGQAMVSTIKLEKAAAVVKRRDFILDVLENDLFPHCRNKEERVRLLGYMANRLLEVSVGLGKVDDRDSYLNKRVDSTGALINNLFRTYYNKMLKDMQKQIVREMNTGSWKSTDDYVNIVTPTNIYKIIKSNTIEAGIKKALSTGDFGVKQARSTKVGVAQVLNRLTYAASLSHLRRINTPIDKSGKLVAPRKLHNSSWGYLCPAETPEGQSVGVVKNLSYMTHLTTRADSESLFEHAAGFIDGGETKIFVNGSWIGNTTKGQTCFETFKDLKLRSVINVYTSVVFQYNRDEVHVCNDAGRLVRPLFRLKGGVIPPFEVTTWDDLMMFTKDREAVLEYLDPNEQNASLIAMTMADATHRHTHCELHPSTIFGVLASCIPFPDHNQSPRNTYQCAMGKQAMGVYMTNHMARMDKTAYVLVNPHRPLVDTRVMAMLKLNDLPSGMPVIVAIMTHTGYNQEDSIMINEGAIARGLFHTTVYHTEKDEDRKLHGDAETRCRPDPTKTKGMKFGNYEKLTPEGLMPKNARVENMDIIMGKVVPIKEARNDPTKVIKFEDLSKCHRTEEPEGTYVDENLEGTNGDGYTFCKIRVRALRKPDIGDKFSSRHGQKGTVGNIIPERDLPFTASGLKPDIIINPHAIPSRMTIAQLKETLLGKVLLELGMFGDGTAFTGLSVATISKELLGLGYESHGNEIMYNGMTGEQIESSVFIGPAFYQRLKHMVVDKQHSRATGPMVNLTRQPAEGRARDGGLRFGEMERDCMISHGAAAFTKGRVYDASDKFHTFVCNACGMMAAFNDAMHIHHCRNCDNRSDFSRVNIPYACKLLFQELVTMNIAPRVCT